jgi:hypothetical protein
MLLMETTNEQIAVKFSFSNDTSDFGWSFMRRFDEFLAKHGLEVTRSRFVGPDNRTWQGTLERSGAGEWKVIQRLETAIEGFVRLDDDIDDRSFSMRVFQ